MKQLLFLAPSAYPLGGVATWLDLLVPALARLGWGLQVGLGGGRLHSVHGYLEAHPGLPVLAIPCATGTREGRVRALARVIGASSADAVVVANLPDAYHAVERLRVLRQPNPRVLMTIHGLQPDLYEDLREFHQVIDGVICTNRLACRLASYWSGADPSRVHYAPYGVAIPDGGLSAPRVPSAMLEVAWVGRIEEAQKRVADLARIVDLLAARELQVRMTIVGDGPDEPWLRERLAPLAARGAVRFAGRVKSEGLQRDVYPASDVLLITSSWETGPIVAWEAMAQGVCVVSSRYLGSGLEGALVDGDNCLLFPVGDVERAVRALLGMLDPAQRGRIRHNAFDLVRGRYSLGASARGWHEALEAVANQPVAGVRTRPTLVPPAGRLDRWLGRGLAESIRELSGRRSPLPSAPGDEWPHSYGGSLGDQAPFLTFAAGLDASVPSRETA